MLAALLAMPLAGCIGQSGGSNGSPTTDTEIPAGQRPHVHDRWQDPGSGASLDAVDLVDRTVTLDLFDANESTRIDFCDETGRRMELGLTCIGDEEVYPGTWSDGTPKIVPPGTKHLVFNVTFEAKDFSEIRLYYQDANSTGRWESLTNTSHGGAMEPGTTTRKLNVTLRETDDGHSRISAWRFKVEAFQEVQSTQDMDPRQGEVHLTVRAVRKAGDLPLEPPHPPFWSADTPPTDTYILGKVDGSIQQYVQASRIGVDAGSGFFTAASRGAIYEFPTGFHGRRNWDKANYPSKVDSPYRIGLVPPDTKLMTAWVLIETDSTPVVSPEVCLWGQDRPGKGYPGRKLTDCQTLTPGEPMVFNKATSPRDTDSLYTPGNTSLSFSRWTFYLQIHAPDNTVMDFSGDVHVRLLATNHNDFEMPAWVELPGGTGNGTRTVQAPSPAGGSL